MIKEILSAILMRYPGDLIIFGSQAAILISCIIDFSKIKKKYFLFIAFLCFRYINDVQIIGSVLASGTFVTKGWFYTINTLLCCILLFFLLDIPSSMIIFAVFTALRYAICFSRLLFTDVIFDKIPSYLISILSSTVICVGIRIFIIPLFKVCKNQKTWYRLSIPPLIESIGFWLFLKAPGMRNEPMPDFFYAGTFVLFIACVLADYLNAISIRSSITVSQLESQLIQTDNLIAMQKERYKELASFTENAKRQRHDMRHQILVIESLAAKKDFNGIQEFLAEYQNDISETSIYTGNITADAIINYYYSMAESEHIPIHTTLTIPTDHEIKDLDLSIILGNCLENAIEASRKLEPVDRAINISSSVQGRYLTFIFRNKFAEKTLIMDSGELPLSSKREYKQTGIGISSVMSIAEKYDGTTEFTAKDGEFILSVMLKYK